MVRNSVEGVQGAKSISLDRPLPVKLACQGCRSSHQRCDGALPICLRCRKEQKTCNYAASRRGRSVAHLHKKSPKPSSSGGGTYGPAMREEVLPMSSGMILEDPPIWHVDIQHAESSLTRLPNNDAFTASTNVTHPQTPLKPLPHHVLAFYSSFWPAHPFLPPHKHFEDHIGRSGGPELASAVDLIGSKYAGLHCSQAFPLDSQNDLYEYPTTGFAVQALILLAIFYHMTNEKEKAQIALHQAVRIALDIGLDQKSFAVNQGRGIPSIEESWRRTWWELYVLDIMFAALNQTSETRMKNRPLEVLLPCAEEVCRAGNTLPEPQSLAAFDVRFFMDDEIEYSSFSYRIAAARALGKITMISCTAGTPSSSSIRSAELEMENLKLHLPSSMQRYVDSEGQVDEVAFQAHLIMNAGTIYLHRPRSLLASSNPDYTIACAPNNPPAAPHPVQDHTRKTCEAADEICHMISASSSLLNHTPFLICGLAMQAIVHLGMYRLPQSTSQHALAEQQIKMSIGALRKMSQVWPMAEIVRQDVKNVARALLDTTRGFGFANADAASAKPAIVQPAPEQECIEALPNVDFDSILQVNDDSWIDEFLGVDAVH